MTIDYFLMMMTIIIMILNQMAFTCVVFPCLLLAYMGQAAYLTKHPDASARIFYDSVPGTNQYIPKVPASIILYLEIVEIFDKCREFVLAGVCDCDISSNDSEPSHDLCNFLMCQTSHGSRLLPEAEDSPHF